MNGIESAKTMEASGASRPFHDAAPANPNHNGTKQSSKSYKKKYRKMRIRFDETMRESNELCIREQRAARIATRLVQENDRLLELLLDANACEKIPSSKRIDISTEAADLPPIPPLVSESELAELAGTRVARVVAARSSIDSHMSARARAAQEPLPSRSLAQMQASVVRRFEQQAREHLDPSSGFTKDEAPAGYLTMEELDIIHSSQMHPGPRKPLDPDLANPQSGYNWLRLHEPRVFVSDEALAADRQNGTRPSRGSKRASLAANTGLGGEDGGLSNVDINHMGIGGHPSDRDKGRKRKREDGEDSNYHPKTGRPTDARPRKRTGGPRRRKVEDGGSLGGGGSGLATEQPADAESKPTRRPRARKPKAPIAATAAAAHAATAQDADGAFMSSQPASEAHVETDDAVAAVLPTSVVVGPAAPKVSDARRTDEPGSPNSVESVAS